MAIRVQTNAEDFGRCGCGRRDYCDGSHALSEAQWQEKLSRERAELGEKAPDPDFDSDIPGER